VAEDRATEHHLRPGTGGTRAAAEPHRAAFDLARWALRQVQSSRIDPAVCASSGSRVFGAEGSPARETFPRDDDGPGKRFGMRSGLKLRLAICALSTVSGGQGYASSERLGASELSPNHSRWHKRSFSSFGRLPKKALSHKPARQIPEYPASTIFLASARTPHLFPVLLFSPRTAAGGSF